MVWLKALFSSNKQIKGQVTDRDKEEGHDGFPPPELPSGGLNPFQMREAARPNAAPNGRIGQQPGLEHTL